MSILGKICSITIEIRNTLDVHGGGEGGSIMDDRQRELYGSITGLTFLSGSS